MERRPLGSSEITVSAMSVGSWLTFDFIDEETGVDVLRTAVERGVSFFDDARYDDRTGEAPIKTGYSEVRFGELWRKVGASREEVVFGNKAWLELYPEESVLEETIGSLTRLQTDYIDVLYVVPPPKGLRMTKLVAMMDELVGTGKVRCWGGLNWSADQITEAFHIADHKGLAPFTAVQLPYNLLYRSVVERKEMRQICQQAKVSVVATFGLGGGFLTNKYADGGRKPDGLRMTNRQLAHYESTGVIERVARLAELARELEMTPAQLALAYCLKGPNVASVTFGAKSRAQLEDNLGALEAAERLDVEVRKRIRAILNPAKAKPQG